MQCKSIPMIVAGNETTTKLIGNAIDRLWRNPEQRARVAADPANRIPLWVEETLRFDNSTQAPARRVAREVDICGVAIPAGSRAVLLVGPADLQYYP